MGELLDIGRKLDERRAFNQLYSGVEIPRMLLEVVDSVNEEDGEEIVEGYQRAIMGGVQAREALRHAIIRARRIS